MPATVRGNGGKEKQTAKEKSLARGPKAKSYLVSTFFSPFFIALRSSLLGLHFSQDFPFLCADKQHLFLHSLPAAAAFSQQVSFFPSARVTLVRNAMAQTAIIRVLIVFMFGFRKSPVQPVWLFQCLPKHTATQLAAEPTGTA